MTIEHVNIMKWKDARIHNPQCNSISRYPIIGLWQRKTSSGSKGTVFKGSATWNPKNDYNDGEWEDIQIQQHSGKYSDSIVLYWCDLLPFPEDIDLWSN